MHILVTFINYPIDIDHKNCVTSINAYRIDGWYPLYMNHQKITLTHINIRQSIIIMISKLILNDILLAFLVIGFYFVLVQGDTIIRDVSRNSALFLWVFVGFGVLKVGMNIYVIHQWLNEYYEITPEAIIHKRGLIFRKTEKYNLDKVRRIRIEDTLLGEIFNFATISFYDIRLNKFLDLYLIHNPDRYANILRVLKPELEIQTDKVRLPFIPKRDSYEIS
jgi:hypothetical protein